MLTTAPHLQVRRPSPTTAEFTVTTCPPPTLSTRLLFAIVFLVRVLFAVSVLLLLYSTWTLSPLNRTSDASSAIGGLAKKNIQLEIDSPSSVYENHLVGGAQNGHTINTDRLPSSPETYYNSYPEASPSPQPATRQIILPPPPPCPTTLYTTAWAPFLLAHLQSTRPSRAVLTAALYTPPSLLFPACLALLYLTTLRIHTTESLLVLRGLGIQTSSTGGSYLASWRAGTRFIPTEKIRDVLINEAFRGFAVRYYLVVVVDGEDDVVVVFPRLLPRRRIVERVWRGCRGCLWEPTDGGVRRAEEKGAYG